MEGNRAAISYCDGVSEWNCAPNSLWHNFDKVQTYFRLQLKFRGVGGEKMWKNMHRGAVHKTPLGALLFYLETIVSQVW